MQHWPAGVAAAAGWGQ